MFVNEYSKGFAEFASLEAASNDVFVVRRIYVDMCDGDLVAGIVLGRIIYWHLPDRTGERAKLRVFKNDTWWLVRERGDWWDECRIRQKQVDRALSILRDRGYITTAYMLFNGKRTTHISLDQDAFVAAYSKLAAKYLEQDMAEGKTGLPQWGTPEQVVENNHPSDLHQTSVFPKGQHRSSLNGNTGLPQTVTPVLPKQEDRSSPMGNPITWDTSWDISWDTTGDTQGINSVASHAQAQVCEDDGDLPFYVDSEALPDSACGVPQPGGTSPAHLPVKKTAAAAHTSCLTEEAMASDDTGDHQSVKSPGLDLNERARAHWAQLEDALNTAGFEHLDCQDGHAYERGTGVDRVVIRRNYSDSNWRVFVSTTGAVSGKVTLVLDSEHGTVDDAIKASNKSLTAAA